MASLQTLPLGFGEEMLLLLLPLLCTEAVTVEESFAEAGLLQDLKIPAPQRQLEVRSTFLSEWLDYELQMEHTQ